MADNQAPTLNVYYMRMTSPNVDARMGKLTPGQIVALPEDKAARYLSAGVAEQASKSDFDKQQERKNDRMTQQQENFRKLNDTGAMWDVSTYRDVLTAPESGLRQARKAGISLVNVHMLRDENGDTLPPDADIEDILDARDLLHPDLQAPFAAHDRSSVMGGGSPYNSNMGTPMPLSPQHREMQQRIADQEAMAQHSADFSYDRNDPDAKRQRANQPTERGSRAERRAAADQPAPKLAPNAKEEADKAGVTAPKDKLSEGQRGN